MSSFERLWAPCEMKEEEKEERNFKKKLIEKILRHVKLLEGVKKLKRLR